MVFKMEINYHTLIEKLKETIDSNYDCSILMFFAGDFMMEEEENIELSHDFSPLLLYFDTIACNDKVEFKELIDFLYSICKEREIDGFDVNYILNKEEINTLIDQYKLGLIPKDLLVDRLKKYFFSEDVDNLIKLFEKRVNISIVI